jgi:hypothetical protein
MTEESEMASSEIELEVLKKLNRIESRSKENQGFLIIILVLTFLQLLPLWF